MQNPFETEERRAFRETVERFVASEVAPHVAGWDEAGEVPWSLHEQVGALGAFGFGVEERWGGHGFDDWFMRASLSEAFGRVGGSGVKAAFGGRTISIGPIQALASEEIKARVLPDVVAGRKGSSLCITEPGGGSDVASLATTARREGNGWVLNGEKTFITGGLKSDYFVVGARTGDAGLGGISLFFVEKDFDGFSRASVGPKTGWWASDTATLRFEDCRVPAENLMGEENRGFLAIMNNFNSERMVMVASMLGMMKGCLDEAVEWAKQRRTFGRPLIERQAIRHKIAEMSARIDMIECYLQRICWLHAQGTAPAAEIAKAKFSASKALEFCASESLQILGGAGYLRGGVTERCWREVKVNAIGGGSEEIMRDLAVRQMGL
jgi:acyl-CoA dehydrogenase